MNNNRFDLNEMTDEQIVKEFHDGEHWGLSTGIDLERCNMDKITNPDIIKEFIIGLCDYIKIKQFVEPYVTKFGNTPKQYEYTFMQSHETSSVTAHFKEFDGNVFIDIFSCKSYEPRATANFCKKFFNSQKANVRFMSYRD